MSKIVTLASMVAKVRSYADLTGNFRTDAEIGVLIQAKAEEFYEELVRSRCHHWAIKGAALTTVAGVSSVSIPTDMLEVVSLDLRESATEYTPLQETDFAHRYAFGQSGKPLAWYMGGALFSLAPTPDAVYTIACYYIPILGTLTDGVGGGGAVQLDSVHGWDEYVCWSVAADLRGLQELDPGYQLRRAEEQRKRVAAMAATRSPTARKVASRRYGPSRRLGYAR